MIVKNNKFISVYDYISSQKPEVKEKLNILREIIKINAPNAIETIGYNMPAYKFNGILTYFAAFKNHYSLFPGPGVIEAFKDKLRKYETSKGTIKFNYDKPVPKKLISDIIKFKVKENLEKKKRK